MPQVVRRSPIPALPQRFRVKSNMEFFYVGLPLVSGYALGCFISIQTFQWMFLSDDLFLKLASIPILAASSIFTGFMFTDFGAFSHDGGHGTLHKRLDVSFLLGIIGSSVIPGFMGIAYNATHFPHHMHCNTERDAQAVWYATCKVAKLPRFLSMIVFGALTYYYYFRDAVRYLKGTSKVPNLTFKQSRLFAAVNFMFAALSIAGWTALYFYNPVWFLFCVAIPWIWTLVFTTHFVYVEHGDTELGHRDSRTMTHPLLRFMFVNNNYHLEHHLYPYAQRSQLHNVHLYLKSINFYEKNNCLLDSSLWSIVTLGYSSTQPLYNGTKKISG